MTKWDFEVQNPFIVAFDDQLTTGPSFLGLCGLNVVSLLQLDTWVSFGKGYWAAR